MSPIASRPSGLTLGDGRRHRLGSPARGPPRNIRHPEFPVSSCLDPCTLASTMETVAVLAANAVCLSIRLTNPNLQAHELAKNRRRRWHLITVARLPDSLRSDPHGQFAVSWLTRGGYAAGLAHRRITAAVSRIKAAAKRTPRMEFAS